MTDLETLLAERFRAATVAAFGPDHAEIDPMIRRSTHADYQANLAMGLGKQLGLPPRKAAEQILSQLRVDDVCESIEIAGPGFFNIKFRQTYLAELLLALQADAQLGITRSATPARVLIDYSGPNVAKEMHVGHIRSTIIGDCLARIFEVLGHTVIRQNHLGDWGTQFGMLIEHLLDQGATDASELSVGELNNFYRAARQKFDADPAFADRSRRRVVLLQGGDATSRALWEKLVDSSKQYFSRIYARLGVTLSGSDARGESFYNDFLADVVAELSAKGIATLSDGAVCVFLPGFVGREGEPVPLIIQKQDGGYGYATTDFAALRYRTQQLKAEKLLYVIGSPQQQHFAMVFEAGKRAGWLPPQIHAEHIAFGSILGTDKKMFKTRSGDTVRLVDLLDEAVERAEKAMLSRERPVTLEGPALSELAAKIGIGALKYADLSSDRIKDYVFDWDRMLAFEGNTGPYLQYAHARACSIFAKISEQRVLTAPISLEHPKEKALALELLAFPRTVESVAHACEPHRLCTYLYQLAVAFTSFYENCPVLKAETPELYQSRLALSELAQKTLGLGLNLLGIEAPQRM